MKNIYYLVLFLFIVLLELSCSDPVSPPPPPVKPKVIFLKIVDVSCTEAFITITVNDTLLPVSITLNKDDAVLYNFNLVTTDTTVIDTALVPNKTYSYQATAVVNGETKMSDTLQVKTLDTTSHNFTWQSWSFGEHSSSVLYDVAIINENNIYAVGEIYINDSTGQPDPNAYNLARWNGIEWTLHRIMFYTICGQQNRTPYPAKAIFVFNENEIWVAGGGDQIARMNATIQTETMCLPFSFVINKLWGESNSSMFAVGNGGNIAHYQNGSWQRIESGTELTIHDIWGINNNGDTKILAVAAEIFEVNDEKILSINSAGVTELPTNGLSWSLVSVWFCNKYKEYAGGGGLFTKYYNENTWTEIPTDYYTYAIRGNGSNDIIICGGYGYVAHYNGSTWKNYLGNGLDVIGGNYYSLSIKGNKAAVVGTADGKAVVLIGTR